MDFQKSREFNKAELLKSTLIYRKKGAYLKSL
nr:MAG TPA: hypothetical protein [Caudoviricetes sp.]